MPETTGLLLGLFASLAWGLTDLAGALAGRRIGSLRTTAIADLASLVILAALFVAAGEHLPDDPSVALVSLGVGCLAGIAYLAFYTALQLGPLSVVSPVMSVYGGLTVVLAVLLLGEQLSAGQAFGALVATAGVALVGVYFERDWRRTRLVGPGVVFGLVALVAFALVTVGLSGPIRAVGWLPALLLSRSGNTALILVLLGLRALRPAPPAGSAESAPLHRPAVAQATLAGVLDVVASAAWGFGLAIAPTWLVGLSSSFGPVVAVLGGVVMLGERPRALQWAGLGLVAASVVLLALG
jgi:drug/metabolite transporter (DMT)-like permease